MVKAVVKNGVCYPRNPLPDDWLEGTEVEVERLPEAPEAGDELDRWWSEWSVRHITDAAQRILKQIPSRASDRGLYVLDGSSIVMIALWSLLLWERKVGRVALERMGVDPFDLARALDRLLVEIAREHEVVYDPRRQQSVLVTTGEPCARYDFDVLLDPLLQRAEHEALELGHNYVGSEHLLLAIVRLANSTLSALLQQHSIDHDRVRDAVLGVLKP